MKNIFFILFILIFVSAISAQEIKYRESEVPKQVVDSFKVKYPDAITMSWSSEDNNFEVKFKLNDIKYEANFSAKGEWIETALKIKKSEVPEAVMNAFKSSDYGKWKIFAAQQVETPEYKVLYMLEVSKYKESKELYYTTEGKFLREE